MLRAYVMDAINGASTGKTSCGTCGFSSEMQLLCKMCHNQGVFILTTGVRQYTGVRVQTSTSHGTQGIRTVSVTGDAAAAGMYLLSRNPDCQRIPVTYVDTDVVAFGANGGFPMNLEGGSFKFTKYAHKNVKRKSRRFMMWTEDVPVFDNLADCKFRRDGLQYVTEIYWRSGPVESIRILRWAAILGNIVETIKTVRGAI